MLSIDVCRKQNESALCVLWNCIKITFTSLQGAASVGGTPPELAGGGRVRCDPQVMLRYTCGSLDMLLRYTSFAVKKGFNRKERKGCARNAKFFVFLEVPNF